MMRYLLKKVFFSALVLGFFSCLYTNVSCQVAVPPSQYEDLILQVNDLREPAYSQMYQKLSSIKGIILQGYCEKLNCFLMQYNPLLIPDTEIVIRELQIKGYEHLEMNIKTGTIAQLNEDCL